MAEPKVDLRKVREFSGIINDTFLFIKQNLKPLAVSVFTITGTLLIAQSVFSGFYQSQFAEIIQGIFRGTSPNYESDNVSGMNYFWVMLLTWASMTAMQVAVIAYMKMYQLKQKEAPTTEEVWNEFKYYYFTVLVYSIPLFLVVILGFMFCIIPGIYLAVVLTPFATSIMVDEYNFGGAWTRCFEIIKNNFWTSLLTYFIVYLICYFASGIISGVMAIITGGISYLTTRDLSTAFGIASSVLTAFSFIFYVIYHVSIVLNYYSLVEQRDATGIMERLEMLGKTGATVQNNLEEY